MLEKQKNIILKKKNFLIFCLFKIMDMFKCKMTGTLWNLLRTTTGAAVVLSTGGIPVPLTEDEINNIKEKQKMEGFTEEEKQQFIDKLVNKFAVSV